MVTGVNTAATPVAGMMAPADAVGKSINTDLTKSTTDISDSVKSLVNSSDTLTHEKLSEIALTLSTSLEVLRALLETNSKSSETKREIATRAIPSSYTAMTGKLPAAF